MRSLVTRGLAVSTPWSLGKEKHSRIDARIFPNPMCSSTFLRGHSKKDIAQAMVTRTGMLTNINREGWWSRAKLFFALGRAHGYLSPFA